MVNEDGSQDEHVQISESPKRYTQVVDPLASPVRSVHPEQMESIQSQVDFAHRTINFFNDANSEDEQDHGIFEPNLGTLGSQKVKTLRLPPLSNKNSGPVNEPRHAFAHPSENGNQRLNIDVDQGISPSHDSKASLYGSIGDFNSPQEQGYHDAPLFPKRIHMSQSHTNRLDDRDRDTRWSKQELNHEDNRDQRFSVHLLAHESLLRGMLADQELTEQSQAIDSAAAPASVLPKFSLSKTHPTDHTIDLQEDVFPSFSAADGGMSRLTKERKRSSVHPLEITPTGGETLLEKYVRTPYPLSTPYRKESKRHMLLGSISQVGPSDSVLVLTIRKCNRDSGARITTVTIPAVSTHRTVLGIQSGRRSSTFIPSAFDDEQLFLQIQHAYANLIGICRHFLARKLSRIAVRGIGAQSANVGHEWIPQPRSPQLLAYQGLVDSFSEEEILRLFHRPALGRSRFAFVHWAQRLADASVLSSPPPVQEQSPSPESPDLDLRAAQPEGLEFILSWSKARILLAILIATLLSFAAVLLWTFLGANVLPPLPARGGGFLDAGDRVATGVLIGICVFLIGSGVIAAWIGVSWLAI